MQQKTQQKRKEPTNSKTCALRGHKQQQKTKVSSPKILTPDDDNTG
jgi:hypothetical protein